MKSFNLWKWYYLYHISSHFSHVTCPPPHSSLVCIEILPFFLYFLSSFQLRCFFSLLSREHQFEWMANLSLNARAPSILFSSYHRTHMCDSFIIFNISLVSVCRFFFLLRFAVPFANHCFQHYFQCYFAVGHGVRMNECVCDYLMYSNYKPEACRSTISTPTKAFENSFFAFFHCYFPVLITQLSLRWIPLYVFPIEYICI